MLVLSRKKDEAICIGKKGKFNEKPIRILVVDIKGDRVSLGIDAPDGMFIHREEILDLKKKEAGNEY